MLRVLLIVLLVELCAETKGSFFSDKISGAIEGCHYMTETATHPVEYLNKIEKDVKHISEFEDKSLLPQEQFTCDQLKQFDGEDGRAMYLAFDSLVYDVTDYADMHPAGPGVIKKQAGADATAVMRASGMPQWVYTTAMKKLQVGSLVNTEATS